MIGTSRRALEKWRGEGTGHTDARSSLLSRCSTGSILSLWSTGSILSIASTGSVLSIGSVGSLLSIGSGSSYALAAARALLAHTQLSARQIAEESMKVAADICVFTNHSLTIEEL